MIFTPVTKKQNTEIGMVLAALLLVIALYQRDWHCVSASLVLLFVTMVGPVVFYPVSWIWFGVAKLLAAMNMRIILAVLFYLWVTPVGWWRRLRHRDALQLKQFKRGKESVLVVREQVYTKEDLKHTF